MRRIGEIAWGMVLFALSLPLAGTVAVICRNLMIDLQLPARQRMLSYGIGPVEFKGWMMYGFPLLLIFLCAAMWIAGVRLIVRPSKASET